MQFQRKTSIGKSQNLIKILIKLSLVFVLLFVATIFINKIDFPYPNKNIEKIIPNEDLKIIKYPDIRNKIAPQIDNQSIINCEIFPPIRPELM